MCVCVCVCVYVHTCVRYCLYIWARWEVEIMKIWQLINFACFYCQNFSMKTKFILIMITLVSLHNIHVLNYTRNFFFFLNLHTKYQKTFSNSFSRGCGLCPVKIITGHVELLTRVHSWTRVWILMCPMITFTGHKPFPFQGRYQILENKTAF